MEEEEQKDNKDFSGGRLLEKPDHVDERAVFFAFAAYVFPPISIISKKETTLWLDTTSSKQ